MRSSSRLGTASISSSMREASVSARVSRSSLRAGSKRTWKSSTSFWTMAGWSAKVSSM
jgi:hypothetical protein